MSFISSSIHSKILKNSLPSFNRTTLEEPYSILRLSSLTSFCRESLPIRNSTKPRSKFKSSYKEPNACKHFWVNLSILLQRTKKSSTKIVNASTTWINFFMNTRSNQLKVIVRLWINIWVKTVKTRPIQIRHTSYYLKTQLMLQLGKILTLWCPNLPIRSH